MSLLRRRANEISTNTPNTNRLDDVKIHKSPRSDYDFFTTRFWMIFLVTTVIFMTFSMKQISLCRNNLPKSHTHDFNVDNVLKVLTDVTKNGSRTAGSITNEVYTREYLLNAFEAIKTDASSSIEVSISEQISNYSTFRAHNHVTSYNNLLNIVLRFHDKRLNVPKNKALLINCHFDTPVNSPGASDVFVSCAIMIETARMFSTGQFSLNHDIIMLFNGAEESILPASHAFIEKHTWAKDTVAFINLEGAGAGGRQVVFQTGPGPACQIFVDAFTRSAQNPSANVIGEELFQNGIIPADTDFRIFRDYGHMPGIDMAYISDGYAYHTEHDVKERIKTDCITLAGNNLVDLAIELINSVDFERIPRLAVFNDLPNDIYNFESSLEQPIPHFVEPDRNLKIDTSQRYVYFDYIGLFIIKYPLWLNNIIIFISFCFLLIYFNTNRKSKCDWSGLLFSTVLHAFSFIITLLFTICLGLFNHFTNFRLSWYARPYNIVFVYILPIFSFFLFIHLKLLGLESNKLNSLFLKLLRRQTSWIKADRVFHNRIMCDMIDSAMLYHFIFTVILSGISPASCYSTLAWVILPMFGLMIANNFKNRYTYLHIWLAIVPTTGLLHAYSLALVLNIFIPIMGRSGQEAIPDVILSVIIFLFFIPVLIFLTGPIRCTKKRSMTRIFNISVSLSLVFAILLRITILGFPYANRVTDGINNGSSPTAQQRLHIFHGNQILRPDWKNQSFEERTSSLNLYAVDTNAYRFLDIHSKPRFLSWLFDDNEDLLSKYKPIPNGFLNTCNISLPYCGIPYHYPFANAFGTGFRIQIDTSHTSKPEPTLKIVSKLLVSQEMVSKADRKMPRTFSNFKRYNLTLAVLSGPPHNHLYIRTEPDYCRLVSWSFDKNAGKPKPMSLPNRSPEQMNLSLGAHYFISHVEGRAAVDPIRHYHGDPLWQDPWIFWLIFDVKTNLDASDECPECIDLALGGNFFDPLVPGGRSQILDSFMEEYLPPWITSTSFIATYSHYRVNLKHSENFE